MDRSLYRRLGDYIEPYSEKNTGLKVSLSQGINNNKYFQTPRQVAQNSENDQIVRRGQFAYNKATTRNGEKISIAYRDEQDCTVSSAYQVFYITDEEKLNPYYLLLWFKRPEFDRYARFKSHGSAHEFFTWEEMCNVMLPVPPIEEQRRIVSEYQTVERRIANNEALIQKLEETAQAIYHHTFVEGIDEENLPEGWRKGCLEDISESISAGTIPVYHESEYLVLGQKCNNNHKIDLSLCKTHIPKVSVTFLKKGDTLINSTGNGTLGRVATVLFHPVNLAYDSNMTMVRPLEKKYSCYISCLLKTKEKYFIELSQGSTNQTRLYCSMIRPLSVLIPTDFVLEEFETRISMLYDYTYYLQRENIHLRTLLSLLTSKLS